MKAAGRSGGARPRPPRRPGRTAGRAAVRRLAGRGCCSPPASRSGAVLRTWGPATPGRCGQCTDARRVFPFLLAFALNPAAPASVLARGLPPAPPKPLTRGRIQGLRNGGSSSNSPRKAPNKRHPAALISGSAFARTSRAPPRRVGTQRGRLRAHMPSSAPRPRGGSRSSRPGMHPGGACLPARSRPARPPKPPRARARGPRAFASPGPPQTRFGRVPAARALSPRQDPPKPPRARARGPRAHVTLPTASPKRVAAPARRSSCSPR